MLSSHRNFALLLFALAAAAYGAPQCRIESASVPTSVSPAGGAFQLRLNFSAPRGCAWSVEADGAWVAIAAVRGDNDGESVTVPMRVAANPLAVSRQARLSVYQDGDLFAVYPIRQAESGKGIVYQPALDRALGRSAGRPRFENSAAIISSILPSQSESGSSFPGAQTMEVHGSGFTEGSVVYWGDISRPLPTALIDSTEVWTQIPGNYLRPPGDVEVFVDTAGVRSNSKTFQVLNPPRLRTVTPWMVATGSAGFTLTLQMWGWIDGAVIHWGNTPLVTTRSSSTSLTAFVPANLVSAPGEFPVTVRVGATVTDPYPIVVKNAPIIPTITAIEPSSVVSRSSATTLTLTGTGFERDNIVLWNGTELVTTYAGSTRLTAQMPASLLAVPATASLQVRSKVGTSYPDQPFWVMDGSNRPVITDLIHSMLTKGTKGYYLGVRGYPLDATSVVLWNGTPLSTTRVSGTQLSAEVPDSFLARAGQAQVSLRSSTGTSDPSTATIYPLATPGFRIMSPTRAIAGGPGFLLTVIGYYFDHDTYIRWNDVRLETTYVNQTTITAFVTPEMVASPGEPWVRVDVDDSGLRNGCGLTIADAPVSPVLTSISPFSVPAGHADLDIVLTATGLSADTAVLWDGVGIPHSLPSVADVRGQVPANLLASPGIHTISLVADGVPSNGLPFTVTGGIAVSILAPASAPAGTPGLVLNVSGLDFQPGDVIRWNGSALGTVYHSNSRLTATIPVHLLVSPGTAQITVTRGSLVSAVMTFTITSGVTLSRMNPIEADSGGPGFGLYVEGSNFSFGNILTWNGIGLTTSYLSSSVLTALVPAEYLTSAGFASIAVRDRGFLSNALLFTVKGPAPTITFLDRSVVVAGSPTFELVVNGLRFIPSHIVQWNGFPLTTTYVSPTRLLAQVPDSLVARYGTGSVTVAVGVVVSNSIGIQIVANPVIAGLSPASARAGSPAITLTVTGSGFAPDSVVHWNSSALATILMDDGRLAAVLPATLLAQPGTGQITVVAGGVTSSVARFQVAAQADLTALQPLQAPAGGSAVVITVSGSGFPTTATVLWNGEALPTSYVSPTEVRATIPEARLQAAGTAAITVTAPGYAPSGALLFAVVPTVHPVLSFTGEATVTDPAQPIWTLLTLNEPTPVDLAGTLEISFYLDAAAAADDYIDPTTQFLSGGRKTTFTIPAGSTSAVVEQNGWLQAGTVAGTLAVRMTGLKLGPGSALPEEPPTASFTIARREPVPSTVRLRRGPEGFAWIDVTGYSTPRDLVSATLAITLDSDGEGAEPRTVTIDLQELLTQWYDSDDGRANGGQFHLTLPLNAEYDPAHMRGVSVRLTNSTGTSEAVPARLLR